LLATDRIDFEAHGREVTSPLCHAVDTGQGGIIQAMLATNRISRFELDLVLSTNGIGRSPLHKWLVCARDGKVLKEDTKHRALIEVEGPATENNVEAEPDLQSSGTKTLWRGR